MSKRYLSELVFAAICLAVFAVFSANGQSPAEPLTGTPVPGVGLGDIMIGASTLGDVRSAYGDGFEQINHKKYSIEYEYKKLGLAFYACMADPLQRIFDIEVTPPFRATTPEGVVLGFSTEEELKGVGDIDGIDLNFGEDGVVDAIDIFDKSGLTQCDSEFGVLPEANEQ